MKQLIIATAFALTTSMASAEPPHVEDAKSRKHTGSAMQPDPVKVVPALPRHCKYYDEMTDWLADKHGEHSVFWGIQKGGKTIREIFTNVQTGSYTILTVTPKEQGTVACIISNGQHSGVNDPYAPHTI